MGSVSGFVGTEALKAKIKEHLAKLEVLASRGEWEHLCEHTAHPDRGIDWWMFPSKRLSRGQGALYQVSESDIEALNKDAAFMASYRRGVCLVALSWGWDLEQRQDVEGGNQRWKGYGVRLGKMAHSLILFGQDDLLEALRWFVKKNKVLSTLEPWVQNYLSSQ